jgi:hypothetical protein
MLCPLIRCALFRLPPELAHRLSLSALQAALHLGVLPQPRARADESVELMGLRFPNRVGLAAGFDKNARYVDALGAGWASASSNSALSHPCHSQTSGGRVCFASRMRWY